MLCYISTALHLCNISQCAKCFLILSHFIRKQAPFLPMQLWPLRKGDCHQGQGRLSKCPIQEEHGLRLLSHKCHNTDNLI